MTEPYWVSRDGRHVIYNADCLEVLPTLAAGSVDAVVTDPPYGVRNTAFEKDKHKISGMRAKSCYANSLDGPELVIEKYVPAICICIKIAKRCSMTPGLRHMWDYPRPDETGCFYYPAGAGMCKWGFNCYQPILFYGPSPNNGTLGHRNAKLSTEISDRSIDHPCPKPIGDWTWLVETSSKTNETVLDPFAGSGTTGVACIRTNRKFIGIEIDRKYCSIAVKRMEAELAQPTFAFEPLPTFSPADLFNGVEA